MTIVANPLDFTDRFLMEAIEMTYHYVCTDLDPYLKTMSSLTRNEMIHSIPLVEAIEEHLPPHFIHSLYLTIAERGLYECVGADDKHDFKRKLQNKEYNRFIPDKRGIMDYLNTMQLGYVEDQGDHIVLFNNPVTEVW